MTYISRCRFLESSDILSLWHLARPAILSVYLTTCLLLVSLFRTTPPRGASLNVIRPLIATLLDVSPHRRMTVIPWVNLPKPRPRTPPFPRKTPFPFGHKPPATRENRADPLYLPVFTTAATPFLLTPKDIFPNIPPPLQVKRRLSILTVGPLVYPLVPPVPPVVLPLAEAKLTPPLPSRTSSRFFQ